MKNYFIQVTLNTFIWTTQETVALIKGFGHAVVIPLILFWITFELFGNAEGALLLMISYLLLPIFAYEYYSNEEGRWLKSQKWFYAFVFIVTCVIISIIQNNSY